LWPDVKARSRDVPGTDREDDVTVVLLEEVRSVAVKLRLLAVSSVLAVVDIACHDSGAPAHGARSVSGELPDAAAQVTRLADAYVSEFIARFPERAEESGLAIPDDGLSDNSLAALDEWHAPEDDLAKRAEAIDARPLAGRPEWVTLGVLRLHPRLYTGLLLPACSRSTPSPPRLIRTCT
jgi:hypothetical protein